MADEEEVTLSGKLKDKLIDSKQKWAADGRLLTGKIAAPSERLPPGQRRVENWPVLDLGIQPEIPAAVSSSVVSRSASDRAPSPRSFR